MMPTEAERKEAKIQELEKLQRFLKDPSTAETIKKEGPNAITCAALLISDTNPFAKYGIRAVCWKAAPKTTRAVTETQDALRSVAHP